jgi:hypothetical protein
MAAGCVIDLAFKVAKGDNKNGFAVVRPPGKLLLSMRVPKEISINVSLFLSRSSR